MGLIAFILIGIIAGYIGRLIMPGRQNLGFIGTMLVGMAGSLVGGLLASLVAGEGLALNAAGIIGSVIGVLIVLFVLERTGHVTSRRRGEIGRART